MLVSAVLGIIDTILLTAQHYRIANEGLMKKSFCTLSEHIDCDIALTSAEAYFFSAGRFRIPNTEVGLLFYALVLILALWAWSSAERRQSLFRFIVLSSGLAVIFSIYMAYILFALETICLFCIASYVFTLVIFAAGLKLAEISSWKFPTLPMRHFIQYIIVTLVLYGLGIFFFIGLNEKAHATEPKFNKEQLLTHFYAQEPVTIPVLDRPGRGPKDAPITILDFSDFQCPFCRRAAFTLKPYLGKYRSQVRLVYLNFPLNSSCNPNIKRAMHSAACPAAKAALCAYQKDGKLFWEAHDLIFENQKRLSRRFFTHEVAAAVGLKPEEMSQCLVSPEIEERLAQDIQLGIDYGVRGTPSVYINGRYLRGWGHKGVLQAILAAELERIQAKPLQGEDQPPAPNK